MKEEILSIASDLREGFITARDAKELLLKLFEPAQRTVCIFCGNEYPHQTTTGKYFCEECGASWTKIK